MPRIVRFRDLERTWTTRRAREPGFMRWLVTWVGGPAGHINTNPGAAIESGHCAVGLMGLPPGQRQAGKHVHGVTEIYVVLEGTVQGFDASGQEHRAGPLDCTAIPAGCPHGVRNDGAEEVLLVWVHDGVERADAAVYYADDHPFGDVPAIDLVRFADLRPGSAGPWAWVGGLSGSPGTATGNAVRNEHVAVGLSVLEPGQQAPPGPLPVTRFSLVVRGEAVFGDGTAVLERLDGVQVPAGEAVALRNDGPDSLHLLWVDCPAG